MRATREHDADLTRLQPRVLPRQQHDDHRVLANAIHQPATHRLGHRVQPAVGDLATSVATRGGRHIDGHPVAEARDAVEEQVGEQRRQAAIIARGPSLDQPITAGSVHRESLASAMCGDRNGAIAARVAASRCRWPRISRRHAAAPQRHRNGSASSHSLHS